MSKSVDMVNKAIRWKEENKLAKLDFADDIALSADSVEDLQIITTNFEKAAAKVGLKISQDKTKLMIIQQKVGNRTSDEFKVEGKTNETVDKFIYLEKVISANGNVDDNINMKIGQMNKIWSSTTISVRLKIRLYHSVILPCLLYASKTWRITVKLAKKLNAFHQKFLCRILNIDYRDHVTNDEILRKTQSDTLFEMITTRSLKSAGHIIRMKENRCASTLVGSIK